MRQARFFAQHGYVVALQNVRGRYKSEGTFVKYDALGATDAFDTIAWLATLPYGDGQVGMWGTSYGAHTQAEAAKMKPARAPHGSSERGRVVERLGQRRAERRCVRARS